MAMPATAPSATPTASSGIGHWLGWLLLALLAAIAIGWLLRARRRMPSTIAGHGTATDNRSAPERLDAFIAYAKGAAPPSATPAPLNTTIRDVTILSDEGSRIATLEPATAAAPVATRVADDTAPKEPILPAVTPTPVAPVGINTDAAPAPANAIAERTGNATPPAKVDTPYLGNGVYLFNAVKRPAAPVDLADPQSRAVAPPSKDVPTTAPVASAVDPTVAPDPASSAAVPADAASSGEPQEWLGEPRSVRAARAAAARAAAAPSVQGPAADASATSAPAADLRTAQPPEKDGEKFNIDRITRERASADGMWPPRKQDAVDILATPPVWAVIAEQNADNLQAVRDAALEDAPQKQEPGAEALTVVPEPTPVDLSTPLAFEPAAAVVDPAVADVAAMDAGDTGPATVPLLDAGAEDRIKAMIAASAMQADVAGDNAALSSQSNEVVEEWLADVEIPSADNAATAAVESTALPAAPLAVDAAAPALASIETPAPAATPKVPDEAAIDAIILAALRASSVPPPESPAAASPPAAAPAPPPTAAPSPSISTPAPVPTSAPTLEPRKAAATAFVPQWTPAPTPAPMADAPSMLSAAPPADATVEAELVPALPPAPAADTPRTQRLEAWLLRARAADAQLRMLPPMHPQAGTALSDALEAYAAVTDGDTDNGAAWSALGKLELLAANRGGHGKPALERLRAAIAHLDRAAPLLRDDARQWQELRVARVQALHRYGLESAGNVQLQALQRATSELREMDAGDSRTTPGTLLRLHAVLCDLARVAPPREADGLLADANAALDRIPVGEDEAMAARVRVRKLSTMFYAIAGTEGASQAYKLSELDQLFARQAAQASEDGAFLLGWARVAVLRAGLLKYPAAQHEYDRADALLAQAEALPDADPQIAAFRAETLRSRARREPESLKIAALAKAMACYERIAPAHMSEKLQLQRLATQIEWASASSSHETEPMLQTALSQLNETAWSDELQPQAQELTAMAALALAEHAASDPGRRLMIKLALLRVNQLEKSDAPTDANHQLLAARALALRARMDHSAAANDDYADASTRYYKALGIAYSKEILQEWKAMLDLWSAEAGVRLNQVAFRTATQCYHEMQRQPGRAKRVGHVASLKKTA